MYSHKIIKLLGLPVNDLITGYSGIVSSVTFDLFGCIEGAVTPTKLNENGTLNDGLWFGISRLKIKSKTPVMDVPDFIGQIIAEGDHGHAQKTTRKA